MTRKEEIEQEMSKIEFANFHRQDGYEFGFQQGAEWADKTMLDKVCDWIEENYTLYEGVPSHFVAKILRKEIRNKL